MTRFLARHSPLFILAGLCIAMAIYSESFRQPGTLQSVAKRTTEIAVLACGELLVILTGGIDLSVGSVAALSGVICAQAMKGLAAIGVPDFLIVFAGVLAGAGVGLLCGTINGTLVAFGRIPPFIVTLGMMMVARGLALIAAGGLNLSGFPDGFAWIGGGKIWWIPVGLTAAIVLTIAVTLAFTRFGRALYAIGGSLQAARLSGISVNGYRIAAYAVCGLLAGFAGVMLVSRTSIAQPTGAEMYELEAIAACVIGGASLMGGEGGAIAALAGALIMTVLRNFCNLQDIQVEWQQVLVGVLIVTLVFYDNFRKRRAGLISD